MTEARRELPGPWHEPDVAVVLAALRGSGPRGVRDLQHDDAFATWPRRRLEDAVVSAWSRNLISVDPLDQLFVL